MKLTPLAPPPYTPNWDYHSCLPSRIIVSCACWSVFERKKSVCPCVHVPSPSPTSLPTGNGNNLVPVVTGDSARQRGRGAAPEVTGLR